MKNAYAGCPYKFAVYLCLAVTIIFMAELGSAVGQVSSTGLNNSGELIIKILDPSEGSNVLESIEVSGNISGDIPEGQHMWLLVNPRSAPNQWWPQNGGSIEPDMINHRWYGMARIGGGEGDNGKKFDIAIILVNDGDNQKLNEWVTTTNANQNWPSILIPKSAKFKDRITVVKSPN